MPCDQVGFLRGVKGGNDGSDRGRWGSLPVVLLGDAGTESTGTGSDQRGCGCAAGTGPGRPVTRGGCVGSTPPMPGRLGPHAGRGDPLSRIGDVMGPATVLEMPGPGGVRCYRGSPSGPYSFSKDLAQWAPQSGCVPSASVNPYSSYRPQVASARPVLAMMPGSAASAATARPR